MRNNKKRESEASLQKRCDEFNSKIPVGAKVIRTDDFGNKTETTTQSEAQVLSGHSAVVWLTGVRGCYDISRVSAAS